MVRSSSALLTTGEITLALIDPAAGILSVMGILQQR